MATCPMCGDKDAEFYTGVWCRCRECHKEAVRRRYHEKMADPEWRERERARGRRKFVRNANRDQEKRRAHSAVSNAIRDGRLTPSDACEDCGHDFSEFRREGHHEDYDRPLDVVWLCSLCHGKRHRSAA